MMKTETIPYQRIGSVTRNPETKNGKIGIRELISKEHAILLPIAFLLGRAALAGSAMPFGVAFFAAAFSIRFNKLLLAIFIILGMVTAGAGSQIYISVFAMVLFSILVIPFKKVKIKASFVHAIIAFISTILPEMVSVYLQGFLIYDLLKAIFYGFIVFSLVIVFYNAASLLSGNLREHFFSSEEMISVAIVSALAVSGLASISIFGFVIKNVLCILLILFLSFKCGPGAGAAVGVTVGLVINMSDVSTPLIIGSYAFCGLLSGVFRRFGRVGAGMGFVMGNTVLTLYLNGSTEVLIYLKEIVMAVIIFMLMPQRIIDNLVGRFERSFGGGEYKKNYSLRIKEMTVGKLNKFSNAFKELARTFNEISETKVVTDKQDISALFDRIADKVCKDCSLCQHCWDRNFYSTYQVMFMVVEKLDSKGRIEASDIPGYFMEKCERIEDFVQGINNIYELFKVDMVWKSKIGESRGLLSQQLEGLSKVISNLAAEIQMDIRFKGDLENTLMTELHKAGIKVTEAIAFENKWGKYEVSIFHKGCGGKRSCISTIEKLVSTVVGRKMTKACSECGLDFKGSTCTLKMVEEETYSITTGVAKLSKCSGKVCGDSYTFMNTGDGKFIVALSDGMGSGQRAAVQSSATINLLEQFMETGFDKDTAVKLINSILILKSNEEVFATIDLSVIDLYNGNVEFIKFGAMPTFIKKEQKVELVRTASLPVGILSNVEVELVGKKLESGDFIIMVSDGITDCFKGCDEGDRALKELIDGMDSINPQQIAECIMDAAYNNCGRNSADDMTVVVAKIWKKT